MNNERSNMVPTTVRRTSRYLDSPQFTNSPKNSSIFEAEEGKEYEAREAFDLRDSRGFAVRVGLKERVKLERVDAGCAYFQVLPARTSAS